VPYAEVHQRVWGNSHLGGRGDVQSVVKRVRLKLEVIGSPLRLQVVRGVGLRLVED
jgi:DNA-binding response OmpR family regulator